MKKVMGVAILFLLVGASFASAQTTTFTGKLLNPDRNGPFTITKTEQRDTENGGRIFATKVKTVGGGSAHFDITIDDATGNPTSIDIYGYTKQPLDPEPQLRHVVTCSGSEFAQIATDPDEDPYPHIENLKVLALCAFNPNGIGETTDGIAYLEMGGTLKKLTDQPSDIERFVLNGTLGGAYNSADSNFVFKGPFGTVPKPPIP
jgi:predicted RecA/RadA family phage recombinase